MEEVTDVRVASEIVDKVIINKASWSDLFAKHDFFHKYRYYLQVIASTDDPDIQIKWLRFQYFARMINILIEDQVWDGGVPNKAASDEVGIC